jgi:transposase InsO family protein
MGHRSHRRAKLTVEGRQLLVSRVLERGWPAARAAEAQGCCVGTVHKWVRRYRAEGAAGLADRCSRPRRSPGRLSAAREQRILPYRAQHRVGAHRIGWALGEAQSTVSAVLARHQVPRLAELDRPSGMVVRYQRDRPGELLHVDVHKQGRVPDGGGWRVHGRDLARGGRVKRGLGYDHLHVAVDDRSRVAYAEIHPDELAVTAAAFLTRAVAWFAAHGVVVQRVLTDNGSCYRSCAFRQAAQTAGIRHLRTRPYRPCTNGKVERFNLTLKQEWAWAQPYTSNTDRSNALPGFLHRYNWHRQHQALNGEVPMAQLHNLPGNHT